MKHKGFVQPVTHLVVEALVVGSNGAGVGEHLAFTVDPCLACHKAPLMEALPLFAQGMPTSLDEVIKLPTYRMA